MNVTSVLIVLLLALGLLTPEQASNEEGINQETYQQILDENPEIYNTVEYDVQRNLPQ